MRIAIIGEKATAYGPLPASAVSLIASLAGRKVWIAGGVRFEASAANIRRIKEQLPNVEWSDESGLLDELEVQASMPTQHYSRPLNLGDYVPARKLFPHQNNAIAMGWDRTNYAYFLEMGLGKTAIMIHNAGMLHKQKGLCGVLIIAPKGVHRQWIEEQIPEHLDKSIPHTLLLWDSRKGVDAKGLNPTRLTFLAMNIDAIRTSGGYEVAKNFLEFFGSSMMIIDESHLIKTPSAQRTKNAIILGRYAKYRRIATGTPISKNITDAFAQFLFLDQQILGYKYFSAFRSRYCVLGGWEGKQIIGQKNIEEFYTLSAPHSFRLTKAEALDLPEKMYAVREYDMGDETTKHYKSMKNGFIAELDNGKYVDAPNAAAALIRLQQILGGYLPHLDGTSTPFSNERLEVMKSIVEQVEGPIIIWARFKEDIRRITASLDEDYLETEIVQYYGETSTEDRSLAVEKFMSGRARFFISNPAAGGTGLNLQGDCQSVIYYSNSFDALHRWQSEDRTHRMGMKGTVTYFDIVAAKSIDRAILRNLRLKKSIASMTLDDIRKIIVAD